MDANEARAKSDKKIAERVSSELGQIFQEIHSAVNRGGEYSIKISGRLLDGTIARLESDQYNVSYTSGGESWKNEETGFTEISW